MTEQTMTVQVGYIDPTTAAEVLILTITAAFVVTVAAWLVYEVVRWRRGL